MEISGDLVQAAYLAADQYGVPRDLFASLIMSESSFNPMAYNAKSGATGIGQFLESTAKEWGVNRGDPYSSLKGAARYLADRATLTGGDWLKAVGLYKGYGKGGVSDTELKEVRGIIDKGSSEFAKASITGVAGAIATAPSTLADLPKQWGAKLAQMGAALGNTPKVGPGINKAGVSGESVIGWSKLWEGLKENPFSAIIPLIAILLLIAGVYGLIQQRGKFGKIL